MRTTGEILADLIQEADLGMRCAELRCIYLRSLLDELERALLIERFEASILLESKTK